MYDLLSVEERELRCYNYFHSNKIETREQLRENLQTNPIQGVRVKFVEEMFSDFQEVKKLQEKRLVDSMKDSDYHQTFAISDMHIPFQDDVTLRNIFDCLVNHQPKNLMLVGDILDCYSISRFSKRPDRMRNLQDEIDIFYRTMKELKKYLPNTSIKYCLGNHEARLEKIVLDNPGLFGLKNLKPEKLFRLTELDIEFQKTKFVVDGFIYYHGDRCRNAAGYTAKAEYEDHRMQDGLSGHVHRLSNYYSSYAKTVGQWYENGCTCLLEPDYLNDPDKANWQQGFTVIDHYNGVNQGTQVLIQNHAFSYGGNLYK